MDEGILWFDPQLSHELAEKVSRAVAHYHKRFGVRPTLCCLNRADFVEQPARIDGVDLRPEPNVLRHHLWIGVEKSSGDLTQNARSWYNKASTNGRNI